ncbi:MAG: HIRAN domain-containing protein [Solobacterium sp.]|nr:HIRAN domain-containing protein [Solobacterium sp.]
MKSMYITVTGMNHRFGTEFLDKGDVIRLVKEPENEYDREAIRAEAEGLGKIGYVANSWRTVIGESYSAGRLYDKIAETAYAKVMYILNGSVLCEVLPEDDLDEIIEDDFPDEISF